MGARECGEVALLPAPPPAPAVALPLREVARDLGLGLSDDNDEYDSDVEMESSPLTLTTARRLGRSGGRSAKPAVELVVLFPAVPALPTERGRTVQEGTVPDSVDGDDSEDDDGLDDTGDLGMNDPNCGGGSGDDRYVCSCKAELGHLNGKVRKLEDLVRLLVASVGLVGWEETRRVENLRRKRELERGVAERDHGKNVAADRAVGEEMKRIAQREEQARKAERIRESQEEAVRLRDEQKTATEVALEVSIADCVQATIPEELVPRGVKVSEAAAGVQRA